MMNRPESMQNPVWISACSAHLQPGADCALCVGGEWVEHDQMGNWENVPFFSNFLSQCRSFVGTYGITQMPAEADRGFTFIARVDAALREYDQARENDKTLR